MAYISVSKMLLEWSFPKRKFPFGKYLMDYQKRKLYAKNFGKILKNTEKIPTGLESPQNSKQIIFLAGKIRKNSEKIAKNSGIYIYYKNYFDFFHPLGSL